MIKLLRAIKTSFVYIKRNFGLSFASIVVMTLSFFIVSVVGLAFYGSSKLVEYIDSKPPLTLYLKGDLDDNSINTLNGYIDTAVKGCNVDVKDKEYTINDFNKKFPTLEGTINDENVGEYLIRVGFVYCNTQEDLKTVVDSLGKNENFLANIADQQNVERSGWYYYDEDQAGLIKDASNVLRTSGIAITIFLFLISSILIFITIKLAINYHRKELEIMDLVGAEGWFIRLPFVIDGMIYGILGALLSTGSIFLFKNYVSSTSKSFIPRINSFFSEVNWPTIDAKLLLQMVGITCAIGAVVGAVSSFLAIIRYVRK